MVISIVFIALLFAVAVIQSGQGLFNALIMAVLTVCCAAAALGTHEWVAGQIASLWKPEYAYAIALGVTFGIPLLILRIIFDKAIRRDCIVPVTVGRVGGGICGLVTALTIAGIAALCVQMMPIGESIFGFSRFSMATRSDQGAQPPAPMEGEHGLWLAPDRFAAAVGSMTSDGVFSSGNSFSDAYPDFLQTVGWVGTVPASVSRYAKRNGISVARTEEVPFVYRMKPGNPSRDVPDEFEAIPPDSGRVFRMIRVQLTNEARDALRNHHFALRQFRLVGRSSPDGSLEQYHPIAIQQAVADPTVNRHIRFVRDGRGDWPVVNEKYAPRSGSGDQVEIVFELTRQFAPEFLEYKRGARTAVRFEQEQQAEATSRRASQPPATTTPPTPAAPPGNATAGARPQDSSGDDRSDARRRRRGDSEDNESRGGRVRHFASLQGASAFGNDLPVALKSYRGQRNLESGAGVIRSGHLIADLTQQDSGTNEPLTRFDVPPDKRLLHFNVTALSPKSTLGKALGQAVQVAQNYFVEDSRGRQYKIVGKYAKANLNGSDTIEIQYYPDQVGTVGGLGAFARIDEDQLKQGDQMVLLFLVDPGSELVAFSTGDASRKEDIRAQTLVAPD